MVKSSTALNKISCVKTQVELIFFPNESAHLTLECSTTLQAAGVQCPVCSWSKTLCVVARKTYPSLDDLWCSSVFTGHGYAQRVLFSVLS